MTIREVVGPCAYGCAAETWEPSLPADTGAVEGRTPMDVFLRWLSGMYAPLDQPFSSPPALK